MNGEEVRARAEDFLVEEEIGVGAFGRVTKVRHRVTRREFAMKAISKKILRRKKICQKEWRLERDVLVRVDRHPYVVELVCAFQTPTSFFLVMNYLPGGELFEFLRSRGTFAEDVAAFYAAEVSLALEHLHANRVIHRDLKPENLLLDGEGHAVVTDFGLAKMFESNDEVHRTLCGTDVYMAPEMVARRPYGEAVDFWSLGVLVYEMLTGKTPFAAPNTKELHRKILTEKIKFPSYVDKDAVSCLKALLERQVPRRLGAAKSTMFEVGGLSALKAHSFFRRIEWQPLARRECPAPYRNVQRRQQQQQVSPGGDRQQQLVHNLSKSTLDILAAGGLSVDGLSTTSTARPPSEIVSDEDAASTVVDFEFCRQGVFDQPPPRSPSALADECASPTSSHYDISSAADTANSPGAPPSLVKRKKGPRKRKKKNSANNNNNASSNSSESAVPASTDVSEEEAEEVPSSSAPSTPKTSSLFRRSSSPPRTHPSSRRLETIPGSPHVADAVFLQPSPDLSIEALDLGPSLASVEQKTNETSRTDQQDGNWVQVTSSTPSRRTLRPTTS